VRLRSGSKNAQLKALSRSFLVPSKVVGSLFALHEQLFGGSGLRWVLALVKLQQHRDH
jgi:hypothetical protein